MSPACNEYVKPYSITQIQEKYCCFFLGCISLVQIQAISVRIHPSNQHQSQLHQTPPKCSNQQEERIEEKTINAYFLLSHITQILFMKFTFLYKPVVLPKGYLKKFFLKDSLLTHSKVMQLIYTSNLHWKGQEWHLCCCEELCIHCFVKSSIHCVQML